MFELTVDTQFAAAHCLTGYNGKCADLHGHTWMVSVTVEAKRLDDLGLSIDFQDISAVLDAVVARFDHKNLNDLKEFAEVNPTAENLARLLFDLVSEKINNETIRVVSMTVGESSTCRVTYKSDET